MSRGVLIFTVYTTVLFVTHMYVPTHTHTPQINPIEGRENTSTVFSINDAGSIGFPY